MYGDLIPDVAGKKKLIKAATDEECPVCGSSDVEDSYGVFVSKTRYMQSMVCLVCNARWDILYDNDLNVVDVTTGG